jgi:hypothetical protein
MTVWRYLNCPRCDYPAIPARSDGTWTEEDEADCPGCGVRCYAFITGNENGEYFEARCDEENEDA